MRLPRMVATRYTMPLIYGTAAIIYTLSGDTALAVAFMALVLACVVATLCFDLYMVASLRHHHIDVLGVTERGEVVYRCDRCKRYRTTDLGDAHRHIHMTPYQRWRTSLRNRQSVTV